MKQISYFKFTKAHPDFIDIDDTDDVKLVLLEHVRKKIYRKKEGICELLPIKYPGNNAFMKDQNYFKDSKLIKGHSIYRIMFRKYKLMSIYFLKDGTCSIINNHRQEDKWIAKNIKCRYLSKREIQNIKRTILIDNMIK
jgi:hypothetical protein